MDLPTLHRRNRRRPWLVVTLGPASFDDVAALADAGADAFRLNASHLAPPALAAHVAVIRRCAPGVPVVVDIQGAKVRLGVFDARPVAAGDRLSFSLAGGGTAAGALPLPHQELYAALRPEEELRVDDGRLRFVVRAVRPNRLEVESLADGILQARKGVNRADHPVALDALSAADRKHLAAAGLTPNDAIACSFMTDGREAAWIRAVAPGVPVIGKVERAEALENIDGIGAAVEAVWICRGDLGAQVGLTSMARWVAGWSPRTASVPTLMAGQVMEHLTGHAEPTRSEICHIFDLVARGYAGLVLSDETAVGCDPVGAVRITRGFLDDAAASPSPCGSVG